MKRFRSYLIWGLVALGLVGASVAVPVALAKAQERAVLDRVVVLQADEGEQLYVTRSVTFAEQVALYASADLNAKLARDAYPAELSEQGIAEKADALAREMLTEFQEQWKAFLHPETLTVDEAMKYAQVSAVLYESPADTAKIAYWQVLYEWKFPGDEAKIMPEIWPLYSLEFNFDTGEGRPYSVRYGYYPYIRLSEDCGVKPFAKALGMRVSMDMQPLPPPAEYSAEIVAAIESFWSRGKGSVYYLPDTEDLCVLKTFFYDGDGTERMQIVPVSLFQQ